ncbi:fibrous sheath CABYR-binding protein [Etheostoma spectabile]|uniref:fibrous sheath CABYR-binding protein n=1 Tax=Etheostoma spectabile TaxID=54343 RepID=UPI0013AF7B99|nr:fibrous sheath CABYR-binding protein-like [Etheostoma spectabile]
MFKASAVLLLTLVLNVQLCSSAPIPAKAAQSSGPGPEKLTPVTEDHSHFVEEKEPVVDTLIPVVAGVAAPSPKESPAEEDIPVIAKEPEPILIGDQVSDDADKAYESQESAPQEPLAAGPQESSEEGTIHEEAAFAEASPEDTTEEVAMASAVESEQHYGEDSAPEVLLPVIPLEASKDEAPEENAEAVEDGDPGAPIPIPARASEDEASVENAAEQAAKEPFLVVPDDNTEVKVAGLPVTPAKEKSVLVPAELEESAPEEPAIIVPVEPAEQELDKEETVSIIYSETKEEEAPEENAKEEEAVSPVVLEEYSEVVPATNEEPSPSTLKEEESVALFSVEFHSKEEGQVEPVAEQTAPQELAPEEPAVIVPGELAKQELEQEETVSIMYSETIKEEAPEEKAKEEKEEEEVAPVVLEENAKVVPATNEEPLPSSTLEESIALFPVEFETEEEDQVEPVAEQTAPQESAPEDPVVIVPLDPAEEEPELVVQVTEESIPIASPESPEEEAPEEAAGVPVPLVPEENAEEVPATKEELFPSTLRRRGICCPLFCRV